MKPSGLQKESIIRNVSVIVEQARKCSDIVRGLLDFSRSSGAEPARFRLTSLIEKVISMVRYQAEKREISIEFDPADEYWVFADSGKIEQVLFNLLINAMQTIPAPQSIWMTTGRAGNNIFFTVADDGPGIPREIRQKIFDPFFSTKPIGEGTGLGLSICAGIVAEANGSIDVESNEDSGTVFTVLLPENDTRT